MFKILKRLFGKKEKVTKVYRSIKEVTDDYNSINAMNDEDLSEEILIELESMYSRLYLHDCGKLPNFKLDKKGNIILEET